MNNHQHHQRLRRRPLRSFGYLAFAASVALGAAACGEKDDEVPGVAALPEAAPGVAPYLDYQVGRLEAERVAAATGSDRHLELHADEVADKASSVDQATGSDLHLELQAAEAAERAAGRRFAAAAASDRHLQFKADAAADEASDSTSRSPVKAV